jgi:hypothetical protein
MLWSQPRVWDKEIEIKGNLDRRRKRRRGREERRRRKGRTRKGRRRKGRRKGFAHLEQSGRRD